MDKEGKVALINTYRKVLELEYRLRNVLKEGLFDEVEQYITEIIENSFNLPKEDDLPDDECNDWFYESLCDDKISAEAICDLVENEAGRSLLMYKG